MIRMESEWCRCSCRDIIRRLDSIAIDPARESSGLKSYIRCLAILWTWPSYYRNLSGSQITVITDITDITVITVIASLNLALNLETLRASFWGFREVAGKEWKNLRMRFASLKNNTRLAWCNAMHLNKTNVSLAWQASATNGGILHLVHQSITSYTELVDIEPCNCCCKIRPFLFRLAPSQIFGVPQSQ